MVLYNLAVAEKWVSEAADGNDTCTLEKNLFSILVNGMEIIVEYSGLSGFFLDIMVQSSHSYEETMEFVQRNFINTIRSLCASRDGCQGVTLQEAIIRPACVQGAAPTLCAYRTRDQTITTEELRRRMSRIPNYEHSWGEVRDDAGRVVLPAGADSSGYLLHGELGPAAEGGRGAPAAAAAARDRSCWPNHIFLTTHDVPLVRRLAVKSRLGRVVPLQFHLQCECRQGEHPVDAQPGRTLYVVDGRFALEQRLRALGVGSLAAALRGAGAVVPGMASAGDVLSGLPLYSGTPVYCDTIEFLSERVVAGGAKKASGGAAVVSEEEVRAEVEREMRSCSAGAWMELFLNPSAGVMAFRNDFRLVQVEYLTSSSSSANATAWLCDEHCRQGLDQGILRRLL